MKVYLISYHESCEGQDIFGIFSSAKKAEKYFHKNLEHFTQLFITEYEVNNPEYHNFIKYLIKSDKEG